VEIGARTGGLQAVLGQVSAKLMGMGPLGVRASGGITALANGLHGLGAIGPLALGAAAAGTAAVFYGLVKCVGAASDLNETVAKAEQVFGSQTAKVTAAADEMARKFGISKREFLDAASMFGLIAQGAGVAEDRAADMGVGLAKLAADAASFYNVGTDVALEKIRAGLVGESEPLRAFGVMLSEDAVKAKALAMGLVRPGEELSNQVKIMARYKLIQEGLAKSEGDLERTGGGWANQLRKLQGNLENLAAVIGDQVMPAFTVALTKINDLLAWTIEHTAELKAVVLALMGPLSAVTALAGGGDEVARDTEQARRLGAIDERNEAQRRALLDDEAKAKGARSHPKGWQGGILDYARRVQEGAFGGHDKQAQQLKEAQKQTGLLNDIKKAVTDPRKRQPLPGQVLGDAVGW
jgi:hypothetical protein